MFYGGSRGELHLAVVRLPGRASAGAAPVVFLSGGPGESAIDAAAGRLFDTLDALRSVGDVVIFDQRGCGHSTPAIDRVEPWSMPWDEPLVRGALMHRALETSRRVAERLRREGPDPEAFQTVASAGDVLTLIDALGGTPAHLVAMSYGTHLAMTVLKQAPDRVARVVLAGPEGPDHTWKLPSAITRQLLRIGRAAAGDTGGGSTFISRIAGVLDRLEHNPLELQPGPCHEESGKRRLVIGRFDVEYVTASGLADTRVVAKLPRLYQALERGMGAPFEEPGVLRRYLLHARRALGRNAMGMCMDCASGATASRRERIEREARVCVLGRTVDFPFPEICSAWRMPDLGDSFRSPPQADHPTLFLTGEWDCRTPHENAEELLPGFSAGAHVRVNGAGHADLLIGAETTARVVAFLRGERVSTAPIATAGQLQFDAA